MKTNKFDSSEPYYIKQIGKRSYLLKSDSGDSEIELPPVNTNVPESLDEKYIERIGKESYFIRRDLICKEFSLPEKVTIIDRLVDDHIKALLEESGIKDLEIPKAIFVPSEKRHLLHKRLNNFGFAEMSSPILLYPPDSFRIRAILFPASNLATLFDFTEGDPLTTFRLLAHEKLHGIRFNEENQNFLQNYFSRVQVVSDRYRRRNMRFYRKHSGLVEYDGYYQNGRGQFFEESFVSMLEGKLVNVVLQNAELKQIFSESLEIFRTSELSQSLPISAVSITKDNKVGLQPYLYGIATLQLLCNSDERYFGLLLKAKLGEADAVNELRTITDRILGENSYDKLNSLEIDLEKETQFGEAWNWVSQELKKK